jgi:hypothetical protein
MALDMLPSFRWRWERRELNGSHPLIATLAEKVLGVNLRQAGPSSHPVLMPEIDWEIEGTNSPVATHTAASTPSLSNTNTTYAHGASGTPSFPGSPPIGPAVPTPSRILVSGAGNGTGASGGTSGPLESKLAEVPPNLFYPFYPEGPQAHARGAGAMPSSAAVVAAAVAGGNSNGNGTSGGDYTQLLAAAATQQPTGPWGASGEESYMLEEKDVGVPMPGPMNIWITDQRTVRGGYVMGP